MMADPPLPVPPGNHTFTCLDGHTCGNPVRLVTGGAPFLRGASMSERRQDFIARHDWIRRSLMFEPRGHAVMSGSILYPPTRPDCDVAILFPGGVGLPADVRPRHDRNRDHGAGERPGAARQRGRAVPRRARRQGGRQLSAPGRACGQRAHPQRRVVHGPCRTWKWTCQGWAGCAWTLRMAGISTP